jgi:hypothetical protein
MKSKFLLLVSLVLTLNVFAQTDCSERFIAVPETVTNPPCIARIKTIVTDRSNGCVFDLNVKIFNNSTNALIVEDNYVINPSIDPSVTSTSFSCVATVRVEYTVTDVRGNCQVVKNCTSSQIVSGSGGVVLPVKLTSFGADSKNGVVSLKWSSESEINFNGYQIEMNDGTGFKSIGTVLAKNNGSANNYSFQYNSLSKQSVQFRLKLIDIDGKFTYSNTALVKGDGQSFDFNIYPNPSTSENTNILVSGISNAGRIQIIDMTGKVLKTLVVNSNNVKVGYLPTGVYMVKLSNTATAEQVIKRLVIVN